MDADEVEDEDGAVAERVPIHGAYNITEVGDSLKIGWWEGGRPRYTWRSLKWITAGVLLVGVPLWAVFWAPIHWTVLLVVTGILAIPGFKVIGWYVEMADKWASVQLKRKQVRHR